MTRRLLTIALLTALTLSVFASFAAAATPEEMYEKLFTAPSVEPEWFTPEVLAQVPAAQFDAIIAQYKAALGEYVSAEGSVPMFRLTFEGGHVNSQIVLNARGQIAVIWFGLPEPKVSGLEEAAAGFHELPGDASLLVASDKGVLHSFNPDKRLAVGSAFKLAIAAALKDRVQAGSLSWDHVVTLEEGDLSAPSGILQDWPVGTPLTVQTLATLMISISDNTATDALLRLVGRETVEMYSPLNRPFLSTREAFALKNPANAEYLEMYRSGDIQQRRAVLDQLEGLPLADAAAFADGPVALDVEWHFTVGELAALIAYVQALPFMAVNPGIASADDWERVVFKGGSEPGVINLTTLVVSESGNTYIVSATWNNDEAALDENHFLSLYGGLLGAVKQIDAGER